VFIRRVSEHVHQQVKRDDFHSQTRQVLAQFWFGDDRRIHYEVWFHYGKASVELGLHFESTPEVNSHLFRAFDRHLVEIQMQLGTSVWLEEWDRGWARIYECVPSEPLDDYRAAEVADRMIDIIGVLQPVYEHIKAEMRAY
jgi:hypothetical protein